MATDQACINESITKIAAAVAKAVVQAIFAERGDGDELTRHRIEEADMRPKLGGSSQAFNFTKR